MLVFKQKNCKVRGMQGMKEKIGDLGEVRHRRRLPYRMVGPSIADNFHQ